MKRQQRNRIIGWATLSAVAAACLTATGCVTWSGDTWLVESAETPEGWPELTPVGEVQVKQYPVYRAAVVAEDDIDGSGTGPMFMTLFDHIKANKIAMTAPVEMGFAKSADDAGQAQAAKQARDKNQPPMTSMAFLYRTTELGKPGGEGAVRVVDMPAKQFASIGVRGAYNDANYQQSLKQLQAWLEKNQAAYRVTGPPRYLGYNSPFVPWFMRYGEVQLPVEPAE